MATNAPIQGTSADLIKLAMVRIDDSFEKRGRYVHLLLQVHDELLFEIEEDKVDEGLASIREAMEGAIPENKRKGVPIMVEGKVGKNWGEMEKI